MQPHQTLDKELVLMKILETEKNFDLVLILEKMDESLILLANLLCLSLEEVTSLKVNEMNVAKENLDESEITVLKDWLWAEYLLYDRFAENLEQNILKFGRKKMELKIAEYRLLQQDVEKMCLLDGELDVLQRPQNIYVKGFKVSEKDECFGYGLPELQFVDIFRKAHQERWRKWKSADV